MASSSSSAAAPPPRVQPIAASSAGSSSAGGPAPAKSLLRSIAEPISDFVNRLGGSTPERAARLRRSPFLGETWSSENARLAYESLGTLRSSERPRLRSSLFGAAANAEESFPGGKVRVAFRNATSIPLVLCWVSGNGSLHHYYRLEPHPPPVRGPSVAPSVTKDDHVETTCLGHAFLVAVDGDGNGEGDDDGGKTTTSNGDGVDRDDEDEDAGGGEGRCFDCLAVPRSRGVASDVIGRRRTSSERKHVNPRDIVGGYRPTRFGVLPTDESLDDSDDGGARHGSEEHVVHVVTFSRRRRRGRRLGTLFWGARRTELLSPPPSENDGDDCGDDWIYETTVDVTILDRTPIDTSCKIYETTTLGGWPAKCEPGWDDDRSSSGGDDEGTSLKLRKRIESDLKAASNLLPPHARDALLKSDTCVYVNKSQKFGPRVAPVVGRGMCYHPDTDWLIENGMSARKVGCVELYDAGRYLDDCDLWGKGGVMLHELCHAYHAKCTTDGYDNEEIRECYERAMRDGLYDKVRVHCRTEGTERTCRAYACTDPMEYFAELSVAFLGGTSSGKESEEEEEEEEFNKWYPFNRSQVKEHDPRAYELLKRIWKVEDEKDEEE